VDVFWDVVSGSAVAGAAQSITGSDGVARTVVTLGSTPGDVVVRAQRGDQPNAAQLYTLHVQGGTAAELLLVVNGDQQTLPPDSLGAPLVVRYTRDGQPVANATVRWEVLSGQARLGNASTATAADGTSSNTIETGSALGEIFVRAKAGTASTQFRIVVAESTGLSFTLVSGNNQRGPAGTRADQPIVVQVTDASGAPVADRAIDWEVVSGGGSFDAPSTQTDATGRSSNGFRFGPAPGPGALRVSISGSQVHVLQLQAVAVQATLSIVGGNDQTARAGTLLPEDLVVQVGLPAAGKALNGIVVRWEVTAGGGSLATATSTTDASGRASNKLTLGPASGVQHVRASIDGASVEFTENATADVGALVIVSGNNQILPTRSPSAPLVVSLSTTAGVPLQGAQLLWSASNAELASVRTTTDAQGRASNVAEVLLPGAATVTVQVEGSSASTVTFSINGGVANTPQLGQPEEDVANAIDRLCPALVGLSNLTPAQQDLRARCLELVNNAGDHPDDVDGALEQLRQDVALAQANAAMVAARAQFDNLKTRIAALRSGSAGGADFSGLAVANSSGVMPLSFLPSSVVQSEGEAEGGSMEGQELDAGFSKWGFFASGILGRGSYDGSSATPEYDYDSNGLTAGVDYRANDQWILGAALGWNTQDTDVAGDDSRVETDGWSVSGYTTWYHRNAWYFDGVLTFGSNDYEIARRIRYDIPGASGTTSVDQLARASTGGDQLSLALSFGRDFQRGNLSFGPYFRGMYTRLDFDGYEEALSSGPGSGLGLGVESRELKSMSAVLGGKLTWALSRDWGILMPHAQFEWEHEFEDDPQQLAARFLHDPTATRIAVEGDAVDSDFYHVGFGLSALFANGRSAFLYYEHLAGSEGLSQDNLSLGVRIEF